MEFKHKLIYDKILPHMYAIISIGSIGTQPI